MSLIPVSTIEFFVVEVVVVVIQGVVVVEGVFGWVVIANVAVDRYLKKRHLFLSCSV